MGPSGCGKSSLLRATAGLWNAGNGTIIRPEQTKSYFAATSLHGSGTLRDQLLYPHTHVKVEDQHLKQALEHVNWRIWMNDLL